MWTWTVRAAAVICVATPCGAQQRGAQPAPLFTRHEGIGTPSSVGAGSLTYDAARNSYVVTGGGANMWAAADHFHFVWVKVSGDMTLEAAVRFSGTYPGTGTPDPHRKAALIIRQSLDSDSPYADAALHGDGLTSLQWRDGKGAATHEVQSDIVRPARLRIEKRGDYISMSVAEGDEPLHPAGGAAKVTLTGEYYIGLAVSAHDTSRLETATFSRVRLNATPTAGAAATTLINTLETISLRSRDRRVAYVVTQPERIEAPNWFPDSTNTLYFNTRGKLYRVQADLPGRPRNSNRLRVPQLVELGFSPDIHSDHGVTRDGKVWAIGDESPAADGTANSLVYTVPVAGGAVRRITERGPSYFHGWSPDGQTIAYCGERGGNYDVYTVSVQGGAEKRLTTNPGKEDGPEFSPDGQHIYYNSDLSGTMQIWRMKTDGSAQEQITNDEFDNWFPHLSPDGKSMVFMSYERGAGDHPVNSDVRLRVMTLATRAVSDLAKLLGGQGTINASSWSPDSEYLAFVSYQVVAQAASR